MSEIKLLDGAALAVSLFNTLTLAWLGLTVLLTAEQRRGGIWLAGGGLMSGALFFLSHTAILGSLVGQGLIDMQAGAFWWRVGWIPVVLAPFGWYTVMLWYAGFWEAPPNPLRRRHTLPLVGLSGSGLVLLAALGLSQAPTFTQVVFFHNPTMQTGAASISRPTALLFGGFIVACIGLSIDALRRPGPTERMMGGLARLRARPWLLAATLTLLAVSLLVAGVLAWAAAVLQGGASPSLGAPASPGVVVAWLDLLIAGLIGLSVLLTGQAVVAYEIFTGNALPRRGLRRFWHGALLLAGGYSIVISAALVQRLPAIYALLLSAGLIVLFYANLGRRSYDERRRLLDDVRPFMNGPRLVDAVLGAAAPGRAADPPSVTAMDALDTLRRNVLHARQVGLMPLGASAPLFGEALFSPPTGSIQAAEAAQAGQAVAGLGADVEGELCRPLSGATWEWIVPLWNANGLCGALLLASKLDGGLYAQEEIEAGRAAAERLVDLQAGAELARRLMDLQRRRTAESQVVDARTRRTLHDEVLPQLHTAMLTVAGNPEAAAQTLMQVHRRLADLLHVLPNAAASDAARLGLVQALRRTLDETFAGAFDHVEWAVTSEAEAAAARLAPIQAETVYHAAREAMRNAARHARPDGPLRLRLALNWDGRALEVWVQDNGVGFGAPGPESAASSLEGGQGLALHSTLLAVLGGSLSVEAQAGWGASIKIRLECPPDEDALAA